RAVLHRPQRGARAAAEDLRPTAGEAAGCPVAAGGTAHRGGNGARTGAQDRVGTRPGSARGDQRQGLDVQLPRQPAGVRRRRPGDADPRRARLHPAPAVRAHLPPPPPLPHHRRRGGDPDAQGGRVPVRLHRAPEQTGRVRLGAQQLLRERGEEVSAVVEQVRGGADEPSDLSRMLAERLGVVLGTPVDISRLTRLTGGASRETWSFEAVPADGSPRRLVLRRDPPGTGRPGGMALEAAAIEAAARVGVAVPPLDDAGADDAVLGSPYLITEHVDGETIPRRLLRAARYAGARRTLPAELDRTL